MRADRCSLIQNYYTKIDRTKIYVDYANKRIKIIDLENITVKNIKRIIHFSSKQHLGKVICICDSKTVEIFTEAGFEVEGKIDGFFKGQDGFYLSYFISSDRKICSNFSKKELLVKQCLAVKNTFTRRSENSKYSIRNANETDIKEMVKLFSTVFSTYPSPVYDEEFIKKTMEENVLYKVAVYEGKIIGIASADMDKENLNAEMTDCATYPDYRGKGVLSNIIYSLELDLRNKGFITLYSIARAINPSINYVLSKQNYKYTGRLINNCNICGTFEDMNIWVKNINDFS